MRTPEQIEAEATEMAICNLDEIAAKMGFEPDEDGIWSDEAADQVLAYYRAWLTEVDRDFNGPPPSNA